jgi:hypothetical protein
MEVRRSQDSLLVPFEGIQKRTGRTRTCFGVSNGRQIFLNVPGAVDGGDGIPVGTGVLQERHEVIAGDDTGRYEIAKRGHGEN